MRVLRRLASLGILLASLSPAVASADTVYSVHVTSVGIQGTQLFITSPDLPASCGNIVYLQVGTGYAEYVMSLALSARVGGIPLARIDYQMGSPCQIGLVTL